MNWRDIADEKEKYAAYLCSREWAEKREAVRKRAKGKCERCRVNELECVHHLTYKRKYDERLADLQGLCGECHNFIHAKSDRDPKKGEWTPCQPRFVDLDGRLSQVSCPKCLSLRVEPKPDEQRTGCKDLFNVKCVCTKCGLEFYFAIWLGTYDGLAVNVMYRTGD